MKKSTMADIILLLVTLVWGTTFVIMKQAIDTIPPLAFNAFRYLIAALFLLLLILLFYRRQLRLLTGQLVRSGMFLGFWLFVGSAFQMAGLQFTTSGKTAFITGLSGVIVPLFSFVFWKHKLRKTAIAGVILAMAGLFLLTVNGPTAVNQGDLLVFVCALSIAFHIIYTGKYASEYPTILLTFVQLFTVAVFSFLGTVLLEDWQTAADPNHLLVPVVFWSLLLTGIPATALAFLAQTACQRFTTAARVALIFVMEPVFAAIFAYFFASETLTGRGLFGCLFIFLGMILAELRIKPVRSWYRKWKERAEESPPG
ncbi:MAG: hypothetical protein K0R47_2607 [Brevibacillus sp.]|nr:hypothetical protein [Brevibacillus sp.]